MASELLRVAGMDPGTGKVGDEGVRHEYAYDDLGRLTADAVTDYPTGQEAGAANFDDSILRIERTYDEHGRLKSVTSYDDDEAGSAVNGILWNYDSWGNVAASFQNHAAAASTSDPSVQYAYATPGDTGSGNADPVAVRLSKVTYPNGRDVYYNYASEGSIGDVLNRIDNIAASVMPADADIYAQYAYLGAGTIVRVSRPSGATGGQADGLTLDYDSGGAHTYAGWDRFGRVVNQQWTTATGGIVDQYRYGYDIAGNRIWRQVGPDMTSPPAGLDELYSYDGLSRLIETQRGDLDLTGVPAIADQTDGQAWDLDLLVIRGHHIGFILGRFRGRVGFGDRYRIQVILLLPSRTERPAEAGRRTAGRRTAGRMAI